MWRLGRILFIKHPAVDFAAIGWVGSDFKYFLQIGCDLEAEFF
jgi:hypothetical protein